MKKLLTPLAFCAALLGQHAVFAKEIKILDIAYYPEVPCIASTSGTLKAITKVTGFDNPQTNLTAVFDGNYLSGKWTFNESMRAAFPQVDSNFGGTYLDIDLGTSQLISSVAPYFWWQDRPEKFRIKVSDEPSFASFSVFATELNGLQGYAQVPNAAPIEGKTYTNASASISGRYIRLEVIDFRSATSVDAGQINLYEVEVRTSETPTNCAAGTGAGTVDLGVVLSFGGENLNNLVNAKAKHDQFNASVINALQEGTRYRNQGAPYLTYSIVKSIAHTTLIPAAGYNGDQVVNTNDPGFAGNRPDYIKILNDANICDLVDNQGVSEIWMWGYHNDKIVYGGKSMPTIVPQESDMSMGTIAGSLGLWNGLPNGDTDRFKPRAGAGYGDISNLWPNRTNDLPTCQHTYTLYNYAWINGVGNAVHDHLHQIENLMQFGYLDKNKNGTFDSQSDIHNYEIFWKMFGGKQHLKPTLAHGYFESEFSYLEPAPGTQLNWICGNTHMTPYATDEGIDGVRDGHNGHYEMKFGVNYEPILVNLDFNATSICEQWNQPQMASPKLIDCGFWCNQYIDAATNTFFTPDLSFYIWWMQHIPSNLPENLNYKGTQYATRNWWDAKADFNAFYSQSLSLLIDNNSSSSRSSVASSSASSTASTPYGHTILTGNSLRFYVNNATWADIHFTINNGAQQNIRMNHNTDNANIYELGSIPAGATVRYFFTIADASGATDTAWTQFNCCGNTSSTPTSSSASSSSASSAITFSRFVEAESFSQMSGVQTETTSDVGGGQNVGWIHRGDWMAFAGINIPTTGAYKIEYRVASPSGSMLSSDLNAGTIQLGSVAIPATGGWQNWATVTQTVTLNAGTYAFGIFAQQDGFNINWFRITKL